MFFYSKKRKEIKENEARLMRINDFEVRYVTTRDPYKYGETIIGKSCVININNGEFNITSVDKIIFTHSIEGLLCSELLSQDGVILSYVDDKTGDNVEIMAYYKYHRK